MSTDVTERLAALSPAPPFPSEVRRAMLTAVLTAGTPATPPYPVVLNRRPRRRIVIGAAAGLAVAAVVVVPALLPATAPGGATPAAAAELHRIAGLTAAGAVLMPGQFRYQRLVSTQTGVFPDADHHRPAVTVTNHLQYWTAANGDVWGVTEGVSSDGTHHRDVFAEPEKDGAGDLSQLPTEPAALDSYLRAHASGSNSVDEAVFSVISTILGNESASPALQAAAVGVLAMNPHVTVTDNVTDAAGHRVERFDFIDPVNRPGEVQSYSFDPQTGVPMGSEDTQPGSHYVSTVEETAVVSAVPAEVIKAAAAAAAVVTPPGSGG